MKCIDGIPAMSVRSLLTTTNKVEVPRVTGFREGCSGRQLSMARTTMLCLFLAYLDRLCTRIRVSWTLEAPMPAAKCSPMRQFVVHSFHAASEAGTSGATMLYIFSASARSL